MMTAALKEIHSLYAGGGTVDVSFGRVQSIPCIERVWIGLVFVLWGRGPPTPFEIQAINHVQAVEDGHCALSERNHPVSSLGLKNGDML